MRELTSRFHVNGNGNGARSSPGSGTNGELKSGTDREPLLRGVPQGILKRAPRAFRERPAPQRYPADA